ncbi:MAG: HAMP domain-containing histidine kinase [Gemmatimonadaceae bacterium]|nr:HAMP domain-containing histidine kinase [Gemmatimonadaceae bacterium]
MPARPGTLSPSRVSLVVAVATMVVLLAALLAYEAHNAAQSQRRTAERALREYATMAATEFRDRFRERWLGEARQALGAATTGLAVSPFDPLVSLAVLGQSAAGVLPCRAGVSDTDRRLVRVDLRSGAVEVQPAALAGADRDALAAAARRAAQRLPPPEEPYLLTRVGHGAAQRFLVIGVRFVRLGAPIALYAFTVCPSALGTEVPSRIYVDAPLLPASIVAARENRTVLTLVVRDSATDLSRFGADEGASSPYVATVALDEAGFAATLALRNSAIGNVSVGSPSRSRVPLLIGLLALTAVLGAVALVQLRREHDLAQMRADFTSSVSHELRTPLTQIMLYGETLLLDRAPTPADRREAAETIVREAGRLMHMVENVLAFGRQRRAVPAPTLAGVNLAPVVHEAAAMLQPLAEASGVRIEVEVDDRSRVTGERAMLRQVVLNLLDNAIKYGGRERPIRVVVRARDGRMRIQVIDGGRGVPPEERDRVWLPYVRLPHAQGQGGTGLGLAVVHDLVSTMRGRAWIEESEGGGATFLVELDTAPPPRRERAEQALVAR